MGRVIKEIEIEGQTAIALFDTGAVYTYVRERLLGTAARKTVTQPFQVALGGKTLEIKELCLIGGKIGGLGFDTDAVPVEEIGQADGHELDALSGALTMERWEIKIDPKEGVLDLGASRAGSSRNSESHSPKMLEQAPGF